MQPLIWEHRPDGLRAPALVCAFTGWNDAGDAASAALQFLGASLENFEQLQACNAGEAVAVYRDFGIAMNDVDVVPCFELFRDLSVRLFIRSL